LLANNQQSTCDCAHSNNDEQEFGKHVNGICGGLLTGA
jgi:hypothetical protein